MIIVRLIIFEKMYSCVNPALITLLCALEKLVTVNDPPSTIHLCE